ncbi:MAG: DUF3500 domain-containing protein [Pyrinomonadaceae bacterium]
MSARKRHQGERLTRREALGGLISLAAGVPLLNSLASGQSQPSRRKLINPAVQNMVGAASEFLNALTPQLRDRAVIPFEAWEERSNWHFFPTKNVSIKDDVGLLWHERKGLSLKEMTKEQRVAAHALLRSALSTQGYLKATGIMQLEDILRETEIALGGSPYVPLRDPELYFVTVFGRPALDAPWGWRVEGHHLSVNFSSVTRGLYALTPTFMGARPAVVAHGKHVGASILSAESEIARELLKSLDRQQLAQGIVEASAPQEIVTGNNRKVSLGAPVGIPVSLMRGDQRALLMRLVEEYVNNWRSDFAGGELERIRRAGVERLHFAWAGSSDFGKPHYYRIHGPKLLIEYDNTQNNANHIHTVYRDLENDFGVDMLRRHYEKSKHH